jgi:hypothetical protein
MKIWGNMRKKRRAITAVSPVVLVALVFSLALAPFSFSTSADRDFSNKTGMAGCDGCCSSKDCCSEKCCFIKKSNAPLLPLSTARAGSAQGSLNALPAMQSPLLHVFLPAKSGLEISRDEIPHRTTALLAQSCIQLI